MIFSSTQANAIMYLRVSSQDQVDNTSLDTQLRDGKIYAKREKLHIVKIFREEGESAKSADRRQLQEMELRAYLQLAGEQTIAAARGAGSRNRPSAQILAFRRRLPLLARASIRI